MEQVSRSPLRKLEPPREGHRIRFEGGRLLVPDDPIIPFIEGDGTGPDIWAASVRSWTRRLRRASAGKSAS